MDAFDKHDGGICDDEETRSPLSSCSCGSSIDVGDGAPSMAMENGSGWITPTKVKVMRWAEELGRWVPHHFEELNALPDSPRAAASRSNFEVVGSDDADVPELQRSLRDEAAAKIVSAAIGVGEALTENGGGDSWKSMKLASEAWHEPQMHDTLLTQWRTPLRPPSLAWASQLVAARCGNWSTQAPATLHWSAEGARTPLSRPRRTALRSEAHLFTPANYEPESWSARTESRSRPETWSSNFRCESPASEPRYLYTRI